MYSLKRKKKQARPNLHWKKGRGTLRERSQPTKPPTRKDLRNLKATTNKAAVNVRPGSIPSEQQNLAVFSILFWL